MVLILAILVDLLAFSTRALLLEQAYPARGSAAGNTLKSGAHLAPGKQRELERLRKGVTNEARELSPQRRLIVIAASLVLFFSIVTYSGRKLWRATRV